MDRAVISFSALTSSQVRTLRELLNGTFVRKSGRFSGSQTTSLNCLRGYGLVRQHDRDCCGWELTDYGRRLIGGE